jgi:glucose-6-phosphate 1-dehydrogenase
VLHVEGETNLRMSMHRGPAPEPCALVIFGATGDLTARKLVPAIYNLARSGGLPARFAVVGFARRPKDDDAFRAEMRAACERHSRTKPLDPAVWERCARGMRYCTGSFEDPAAFARLRVDLEACDRELGTAGNRLFYLSTPPSVYPAILRNLAGAGLVHPVQPGEHTGPWSRVIVEKPIGRDLASAMELNELMAEVLDESQTYRIDHYLGKETVQNILVFRFGNAIFEPIWNRKYIDHVQITAAESIGVEGRGAFYEEAGVIRDIVQNHLLQVLALTALEPPISFGADDVRDESVQVLRCLRHYEGDEALHSTVVGQYGGYRGEPGVRKDSVTPTYVAMRMYIDNWRWHGVPFFLRAGKGLAKRVTEVAIQFQEVPLVLFDKGGVCNVVRPNTLVLRIQPDEGISMQFVSKVPGDDIEVAPVSMDFRYASGFGVDPPEAYERLILDCMRGDATLFIRRDGVEHAWRFIDPILAAHEEHSHPDFPSYERGSWGPTAADRLLAETQHRWRKP